MIRSENTEKKEEKCRIAMLPFLSGQVTFSYFDCETYLWIENREVIEIIEDNENNNGDSF